MISRDNEPESTTVPAAQAAPPSQSDRRRPTRSEDISLHLISLRRQPTMEAEPDANNDDLRGPKGIVFGFLLSLWLWTFILAGISLAMR